MSSSFADRLEACLDDYFAKVTPEQFRADYDKSGAAFYADVHFPGSLLFSRPAHRFAKDTPAVWTIAPKSFPDDRFARTFSPPRECRQHHQMDVEAGNTEYALAA